MSEPREQTCHNGHTTLAGIWNCPVCTDAKLALGPEMVDLLKRAQKLLAWDPHTFMVYPSRCGKNTRLKLYGDIDKMLKDAEAAGY